jgi:hypothetical protein
MQAKVEMTEGTPSARTQPSRSPGTFALTGPLDRSGAERLPVRGDLAHVALAGRFFVPHYAMPQPRAVMPGGAALHAAPDSRSPVLCHVLEGESFELLDITGEWAWGCLSLDGPTGYVHADRLEALP